jgi:hypothetical protein
MRTNLWVFALAAFAPRRLAARAEAGHVVWEADGNPITAALHSGGLRFR